MFRTRETRPGPGALYTPGTAVPARPRVRPVTAACRLATAGPCHPGAATRPGMSSLTRHQQGFTGVRPSRPFPSPVIPGRNGNPWAFPRASHPAEHDPAAHAGAGTSLRHWPGVTPSSSTTSFGASTHRERPHVATHLTGVLSNQATEASITPIVPVQRAPCAFDTPEMTLFTRWIEAKPGSTDDIEGWQPFSQVRALLCLQGGCTYQVQPPTAPIRALTCLNTDNPKRLRWIEA